MKPPPPLIVIADDRELALAEFRVTELRDAKRGSTADAERLGWIAAIDAYENRGADVSRERASTEVKQLRAIWIALAAASIVAIAIGLLLYLS
jgi:hypothetical protein